MQAKFAPKGEGFFFNISGLLMVAIISLVVLINWQGWSVSGPQIALMAAFAAMLTRQPELNGPRSQAYLYLGTQLIILVFALSYSSLFIFLFYVLSVQTLMLLPMRTGLRWLLLFTLITALVSFYHNFEPYENIVTTLINGAGFFFFGAFGNALVQARQARDESQRILAELTDAHARLQVYAEQAETLAVSEERNRMSREMHDTLGHRLTVSIVQLEGAGRLLEQDTPRAGQMIQTVREQLVEGLTELRATLAAMRDSGLAGTSLRKSLQNLVDDYAQATGLPVHLAISDNLLALDEARRMTIYRAAQEALTNTQRHAAASAVWMEVQQTSDAVALCVEDDGVGMDGDDFVPGIGLRGMQERAQQLGGSLTIDASPRGGVGLKLTIPLAKEEANG
ncbi:MAG: sensor histidine kinase [Caldilineaceae bacterium]